jgi:predicted transcriptional regulator
MPEGTLTPHQHEIMSIVWSSKRRGISSGKVWQAIKQNREVARTTIINLIDRLEQRGWLERRELDPDQSSTIQFVATVGPRQARAQMLQCFVNDYYDGSAAELSKSLLRWRCLTIGDMGELRSLLDKRIATCHEKIKRATQQTSKVHE